MNPAALPPALSDLIRREGSVDQPDTRNTGAGNSGDRPTGFGTEKIDRFERYLATARRSVTADRSVPVDARGIGSRTDGRGPDVPVRPPRTGGQDPSTSRADRRVTASDRSRERDGGRVDEADTVDRAESSGAVGDEVEAVGQPRTTDHDGNDHDETNDANDHANDTDDDHATRVVAEVEAGPSVAGVVVEGSAERTPAVEIDRAGGHGPVGADTGPGHGIGGPEPEGEGIAVEADTGSAHELGSQEREGDEIHPGTGPEDGLRPALLDQAGLAGAERLATAPPVAVAPTGTDDEPDGTPADGRPTTDLEVDLTAVADGDRPTDLEPGRSVAGQATGSGDPDGNDGNDRPELVDDGSNGDVSPDEADADRAGADADRAGADDVAADGDPSAPTGPVDGADSSAGVAPTAGRTGPNGGPTGGPIPGSPSIAAAGPDTRPADPTAVQGTHGPRGAEVEGDAADPLWLQVRRALGSLRTLQNGEQQVTIRLRPAELGSVMVRVNAGESGTSVSLLADSAVAASQLGQQRQLLISELEQSGLDGVAVDVNTGTEPDGPQTGASDDPEDDGDAGPAATAATGAGTAGVARSSARGRGARASSGLVDLEL